MDEISPKEAFENNLRIMRKGETYDTHERRFARLKPLKATIFLLHLAGFRQKQIVNILKISQTYISLCIKDGYKEYPHLKTFKK